MTPTTPVYVSGDVRDIQDFIFSSSRLLEMRGASRLLDFFDRAVVPRLAKESGGDVVFSGGGNFLAIFEQERAAEAARKFEDEARAAFFELTAGHGIEIQSLTSAAPFREAFAALQKQMRLAKQSSSVRRRLSSMPFLKRCDSCGRETADRAYPRPRGEGDPQWLGPACDRKRTMHRTLKSFTKKGKRPWFRVHLATAKPLVEDIPPFHHDLPEADFAQDFHEMTDGGHLAILAADGNNLGKWFRDLETRAKYGALSEKVDTTLRNAIAAAAEAAGNPRRMQILFCGGDDLVMALPARGALQFAAKLLAAFRVPHQGGHSGLGAGLVFCRPGFPFRQAHELAKELQGQAKKRCRQDDLESALAFHRVLGSHVRSLDREQGALLRENHAGQAWSYGAAGPYSLPELNDLFALGRRLGAVSRSQRGVLREILSPRDDGPETPLDPHTALPHRLLAELRAWLARQPGEAPFELPTAKGSPLVSKETLRRPEREDRVCQRLVLADALLLASHLDG